MVGAATRLHAVVKADAYGHGIDRIVPACAEADGIAVIELENAVRARTVLGWAKEIVVLEGFYAADELHTFAMHNISAVVHSDAQLAQLEATRLPRPISIYLKINSGMNRLGFPLAQAHQAFARARACANISEITLATHFARADEPNGFAGQLQAFNATTAGIQARRSLANSGATAQFGSVGGDIARPGILLYGASPIENQTAASFGLKPVMRLNTEVIAIQQVRAGETVGYGGANVAPHDMRVAVLAGGYADGYPRGARNGTPVWVAGARAPLFGRVSMDKITVDVSNVPSAQIGATAELWGTHVSADEVAACAGTISYALFTGLGRRVKMQLAD